LTRTYLSTSIRESQRGLLFYSIALHQMTIQELIKKLNDLEDNAKQIQASHGSQYWLQQVAKFEDLFTWHPEVDKTCTSQTFPWRLEMK